MRLEWPWPTRSARAIDAFGKQQPVPVKEGRAVLELSATPLFMSPG